MLFVSCFYARDTCRADVKLWPRLGNFPSLTLHNWTQFESSLEHVTQSSHGLIFQQQFIPQLVQCLCPGHTLPNTLKLLRSLIQYLNIYTLRKGLYQTWQLYFVFIFNSFFRSLYSIACGVVLSLVCPPVRLSTFGSDHTQRQKQSHLRGHDEEAKQFTKE